MYWNDEVPGTARLKAVWHHMFLSLLSAFWLLSSWPGLVEILYLRPQKITLHFFSQCSAWMSHTEWTSPTSLRKDTLSGVSSHPEEQCTYQMHNKIIVAHTEVKEYPQRHLGRWGFCKCLGLEVIAFPQLQEHGEGGSITITGLEWQKEIVGRQGKPTHYFYHWKLWY